mmetsp:Transcript_228/g.241  ORF Transcript_228/g.241 Transcript_228/m.241 type:complete len:141 (+) Transcript_228:947-1369(+)
MHSVSTRDPKKNLSGDGVKNINILDLVVDWRRKYQALRKNISWDVINKNMVTGIRIMCINKWNQIYVESGERAMLLLQGIGEINNFRFFKRKKCILIQLEIPIKSPSVNEGKNMNIVDTQRKCQALEFFILGFDRNANSH